MYALVAQIPCTMLARLSAAEFQVGYSYESHPLAVGLRAYGLSSSRTGMGII